MLSKELTESRVCLSVYPLDAGGLHRTDGTLFTASTSCGMSWALSRCRGASYRLWRPFGMPSTTEVTRVSVVSMNMPPMGFDPSVRGPLRR